MSRQNLKHRLTALFATVVVGLGAVAIPAPATAAPDDLCAEQVAAMEAVNKLITRHNAKPNRFTQQQAAAAAAYDAEAAKLNTQGTTAQKNLYACLDAMSTLGADDTTESPLNPPSADKRQEIADAVKKIPASWQPSPQPAPQIGWRVPRTSPTRPLYDALRSGNPGELGNVRLQGQTRPRIGDPDPAYPGRTIGTRAGGGSAVTPDHIVPIAEIINMKGFTKLNPDSMYAVTRAPLNYQWLSFSSNLSKSSRSVAAMTKVDPAWQAEQVALEKSIRPQLEELIQKLLKSQGKN